MRYFWKNVSRGFVVIIPFWVTFTIALWLLVRIERLMGGAVKYVLPFLYFPGMGIVFTIVVLYLAGRFMDKDRPGFDLTRFAGRQMEKTPYVKTVFTGVRDIIRSLSMLGERGQDAKQVVLVSLGGDARILGLVTAEEVPSIHAASNDATMVAVYIPFSYQLGGFTVFVPRNLLQKVDISAPQAMEIILSAAMAKGQSGVE
ncbi:MAG: DUF502 domain-containing protein [Syntrophobacteraceae bacterium]